jgi:hypothetical protein
MISASCGPRSVEYLLHQRSCALQDLHIGRAAREVVRVGEELAFRINVRAEGLLDSLRVVCIELRNERRVRLQCSYRLPQRPAFDDAHLVIHDVTRNELLQERTRRESWRQFVFAGLDAARGTVEAAENKEVVAFRQHALRLQRTHDAAQVRAGFDDDVLRLVEIQRRIDALEEHVDAHHREDQQQRERRDQVKAAFGRHAPSTALK